MARAKVRFVAMYEGRQRQILSAEERRDGSVLLAPRLGLTLTLQGETDPRPIHSEHVSVHSSPQSAGTTITHTTNLKDGRKISNAAFIKDTGDFLYVPVMYARCGRLDHPTYHGDARPRDTVLEIGSPFVRAHTTCLIYLVVVANPSHSFAQIKGSRLTTHVFRHFTLAVYSTFLNLPAITPTWTHINVTSPTLIDGSSVGEKFSDGMSSIDPSTMEDAVLDRWQRLALNMVQTMEEIGLPDLLRFELQNLPLWFTPFPPSEIRKEGELELRALLDRLMP